MYCHTYSYTVIQRHTKCMWVCVLVCLSVNFALIEMLTHLKIGVDLSLLTVPTCCWSALFIIDFPLPTTVFNPLLTICSRSKSGKSLHSVGYFRTGFGQEPTNIRLISKSIQRFWNTNICNLMERVLLKWKIFRRTVNQNNYFKSNADVLK